MTRALTSWSLAMLLALVASVPFARAAEALRINGREYLRLTEWAKANHLELAWLKRDETLQLSNRSSKLLLTLESREAQLNGVQVVLLFPVLQREGKLFLARSDTQSTLQPLLAWPKYPRGALLNSVCLDPGHGGKDPGNQAGSNQEKKYTLLLAQELRRQLARAGFKVMLTRTSDSFVELPDRPALANRKGADLFVSLHFNSADSSQNSVRGAEVYCVTPPGAPSTNAQGEGGAAAACPGNRNNDKNTFLAYEIQKALIHGLAVEDRGIRRARFAVLRDASMPAVLIEAGFMSHPGEGRKIFDAGYRRQIAHAIVEGIVDYKRQVEVK